MTPEMQEGYIPEYEREHDPKRRPRTHVSLASSELLQKLVDAELVVSFCYGRCGQHGVAWSVDVLRSATLESFGKLFLADSLEMAIKIAVTESIHRQWMTADTDSDAESARNKGC